MSANIPDLSAHGLVCSDTGRKGLISLGHFSITFEETFTPLLLMHVDTKLSRKRLQYIFLLLLSGLIHTTHAQVKIAAHRGGSYDQYPESSMALFDSTASSFGKDTVFIEIDLRKSKDGTIYLMHDQTVDRTTTGNGQLEDLSDAYLNSLRLKTKAGKITSEHILTFKEVLSFISERNMNLMLDIKKPIHREAIELVKNARLEERMLVLTFQDSITAQVAGLSQNALISALIETEEAWKNFEKMPIKPGNRIAYITNKTPATLIAALRQNNVLIMADVSEELRNAATPLNADQYREKVKEQNLDILITDFPTEAREALNQKK